MASSNILNWKLDELIDEIKSGNSELVEQLWLQINFNVNQNFPDGSTLLCHATEHDHIQVVQQLLKLPKIDVNQSTTTGETPLYIACVQGYVEIANILLKHKDIDINQKIEGDTILMRICSYVKYLQNLIGYDEYLAEGKGVRYLKGSFKRTTMKNTKENNLIKLLRIHEVKIFGEIYNQNGSIFTKQIRPAVSAYCKIIQLLLSHEKTEVDFCNEEGETVLFCACEFGHAKFVKLLLDQGADINAVQTIQENQQNIQENSQHQQNSTENSKQSQNNQENSQHQQINQENSQQSQNNKKNSQHWQNNQENSEQQQNSQELAPLNQQTTNALLKTLDTEIEFFEKLEVLFSRLDLEPNQKITMKVKVENEVILVNGNIVVASIMKNFGEDDASQLLQIFRVASKSIYTFDITFNIQQTYSSGYNFTNVLDFLIFHEKFTLVSVLFQGILDGQIQINQLKYFLSAFPKMLEKGGFEKILTSFVKNEALIVQRITQKNPHQSVFIDIDTPVVQYLRSLISKANQYYICQSIFIRAAVDGHWTIYTKWYYRIQLINFLIYLFLFILAMGFHIHQVTQNHEDEEFPNDSNIKIILWASFPFVIVMLLREILKFNYSIFFDNNSIAQKNWDLKRFQHLLRKIFRSKFTIGVLDWFIICVGFLLPIIWSPKNDSLMSLTAVFVMVLFHRLQIWLLPSKTFGHYILMIFLIASKTFSFLIILLVMLSFFTLSFTLIFQKLEQTTEFDNQQFQVALGLFGNIELDDFYSPKSPYKETGLILLAIFIVVVPILLINLQIALMTSIYEQVAQQRDAAFVRNKTSIALESIRVFENIGRFIPFFKNLQNNSRIIELKPELGYIGMGSAQLQNFLLMYFSNVDEKFRRIEDLVEVKFAQISQKIDNNKES